MGMLNTDRRLVSKEMDRCQHTHIGAWKEVKRNNVQSSQRNHKGTNILQQQRHVFIAQHTNYIAEKLDRRAYGPVLPLWGPKGLLKVTQK